MELEPGIGICTEASSQKPKTRGHVEGNGSPYYKLPRSWSDRIAGCAGRKNESKPASGQELARIEPNSKTPPFAMGLAKNKGKLTLMRKLASKGGPASYFG